MIKKTLKYIDFNGNERTEDFYFHLTEAELTEWELSIDGGLTGVITRIINSQDQKQMIEIFKSLLMKSYGEKSADGRRFVKNQDVLDSFMQTQAFSDIYMELATNDKAASEFVNGLMPESVKQKMKSVEENK